jgi:sodium/potassium-transporting ATPase subunit alpha
VTAVEEGRLIFDNLKKSIAYALSAKLPEVLPFLAFVILGLPLPLSTALVLCIDIGTDLIPGIALAYPILCLDKYLIIHTSYERPEVNMMKRGPRNPAKHKLVNGKLIFFSLILCGIIQTMSGFLSYFITMNSKGFPPSVLFFSARKYFQRGAPDLIVGDQVYVREFSKI